MATLLIAGVFTISTAEAQTPVGIANLSGDSQTAAAGIAANNPWFGAQIVHRFGTEGEFASNLLAAGQFVYDVPLGAVKFHVPVISNFGGNIAPKADPKTLKESIDAQLKELLDSTSGITAGLFPYYPFQPNDTVMLTVHGLAAWRYNGFKPFGDAATNASDDQDGELVDIHQLKIGAGIEAVFGKRDDGPAAITFSVTPVVMRFTDKEAYRRAFGEVKSSVSAVELVGILPLQANGLGLVFENVVGGGASAFRIGLVFVGQP